MAKNIDRLAKCIVSIVNVTKKPDGFLSTLDSGTFHRLSIYSYQRLQGINA